MDKFAIQVSQLCAGVGTRWQLDGNRLVIPVGDGGRQQEIRFKQVGDEYVLTSIVMGSQQVTKSTREWRELARLAWQRNAAHELVTFAFDSYDRLVGQIRHPAAHLDIEELECYVTTLARECDRFQYLLTGKDER